MSIISHKEIESIARTSHLALLVDESSALIQQLEAVLDYASRVKQIGHQVHFANTHRAVNVYRNDVAVPCVYAAAIVKQAPEAEGNYFVVPIIIDETPKNSSGDGA